MDRMLVTLGERIAARRKELGLRQEDLANAAGVTTAAVSYWETGNTKNLRLEHLFSIADKLKVQARWLALGQGAKFAALLFLVTVPPLLIDAAQQIGCVLCQIARFVKSCLGMRKFLAMLSGTCRAPESMISASPTLSKRPCAHQFAALRKWPIADLGSSWRFSPWTSPGNIPTSLRPFATH